jgi:hypothetical protein
MCHHQTIIKCKREKYSVFYAIHIALLIMWKISFICGLKQYGFLYISVIIQLKWPILSAVSLICRGRNMLCFSHYIQPRMFKVVFTFSSLFLFLVFFTHFLLTLIFVYEIFLSVYISTCNETKKLCRVQRNFFSPNIGITEFHNDEVFFSPPVQYIHISKNIPL